MRDSNANRVALLGLLPKALWYAPIRRDRILNILDVLQSYSVARRPVNPEWIAELAEHLGVLGEKDDAIRRHLALMAEAAGNKVVIHPAVISELRKNIGYVEQ